MPWLRSVPKHILTCDLINALHAVRSSCKSESQKHLPDQNVSASQKHTSANRLRCLHTLPTADGQVKRPTKQKNGPQASTGIGIANFSPFPEG